MRLISNIIVEGIHSFDHGQYPPTYAVILGLWADMAQYYEVE